MLHILALIVFLFSHFLPIFAIMDCLSCASPSLHNQWQATGLPTIPPPDRFSFHTCDGTTSDYKPCGDVCMEMLVAIGNEYGVVRGCMSDFYEGYTVATNNDHKCYYGEYPHNVTIYDPVHGSKTYSSLYVGIRYCSTSEKGEGACNIKLVAKRESANGGGAFDEDTCRKTQQCPVTTDCLSCFRYDWTGDCNWWWRVTCPGQWCTKTMGYVNGRWLESRGCAPYNPSGNPMCVKLESSHSFSLFDNHPIEMPYSLERCYCQGSRCNGAFKAYVSDFSMIFILSMLLIPLISIEIISKF